MRYIVVEEDSITNLTASVNELIHDGWRPFGSLSVLRWEWENERKGYTESSWAFYQPMVKEEE